MTLSIKTFSITTFGMKGVYATLSQVTLSITNALPLCSVSFMSVSLFIYDYAECHYAEYGYAECLYAGCLGV